MPAIQIKKTKEARLYIRATASQKQLIVAAAEKERKSSSDFVLENALSAAEAIVADDANLTLGKEKWSAFCAALDAAPRRIPSLRKLLIEPGVFDAK